MSDFIIKKGLDIPIGGRAEKVMVEAPYPSSVALYPDEFHFSRTKLLVKEGDTVYCGSPLFYFKHSPDTVYVSPDSGKVKNICLGEKRKVLAVVVEPDKQKTSVNFGAKSFSQIKSIERDDIISYLQKSGFMMFLRERPFGRVPDGSKVPKAIFINAMNTDPNAPDAEFVLRERTEDIEAGIGILHKLTKGNIHLCFNPEAKNFWSSFDNVKKHTFEGPHPSGLVSTHIAFIDPINKGEAVWYLSAVHLASLGACLRTGCFQGQSVVVLTGPGIKPEARKYYRTILGASAKELIAKNLTASGMRIISGSVLTGRQVGIDGHMAFYEASLSALAEGRGREFLGWAMPGLDKYSAASRAFLSNIFCRKDVLFDTKKLGSKRAIVWTDVYDSVMPLDIYTNFLLKAILAGDIEEAENLGLLEVAPEDFALATFLCPSKIEVSGIVQQGLEMAERENI